MYTMQCLFLGIYPKRSWQFECPCLLCWADIYFFVFDCLHRTRESTRWILPLNCRWLTLFRITLATDALCLLIHTELANQLFILHLHRRAGKIQTELGKSWAAEIHSRRNARLAKGQNWCSHLLPSIVHSSSGQTSIILLTVAFIWTNSFLWGIHARLNHPIFLFNFEHVCSSRRVRKYYSKSNQTRYSIGSRHANAFHD